MRSLFHCRIFGKHGFTLVEVMIVVVIISLLAAIAIPSFQKIRQSSIERTLINDARQLGSAAQQYLMETGAGSVAVEDLIGTEPEKRVTSIGPGNRVSEWNITPTYQTDAFRMENLALSVSEYTFDSEGKKTAP